MTVSSPNVRLECDGLAVGRFFSVNFQRTLRLPDDGRDYPLPPGFGRFPLRPVDDFAERVPAAWLEQGGFLLPMHRHEALWLSFNCPFWHPVAVRVDVGGVCALTGAHDTQSLSSDPQNYMVVPDQPWIDGIKAGEGTIRQFVAAPLGEGVTVEGQVTGAETKGGIQLTIVEPKAGRFPDENPRATFDALSLESSALVCEDSPASFMSAAGRLSEALSPMGLGAGGRMVQKIYPDEYGIDTWDSESAMPVHIHLVDARDWRSITGEEPPPSPISVETYKKYRLPWYALQDDDLHDLPVMPILANVKPI
jgi:hypothetical protein